MIAPTKKYHYDWLSTEDVRQELADMEMELDDIYWMLRGPMEKWRREIYAGDIEILKEEISKAKASLVLGSAPAGPRCAPARTGPRACSGSGASPRVS